MKTLLSHINIHACNLKSILHAICRLPILIFDIPFFYIGQQLPSDHLDYIVKNIRPGDIILYTDKIFPLWQLIVKIVGKSYYNHAGIYEGNEYVIEATTFHPDGSCVARTDIRTFLQGYKSVCVIRPPYHLENTHLKTIDFALSQLGKPYDYKMDLTDNNTLYCTELVAKSLYTSNINTPVFCFWGRKFYVPDAFLKIPDINIVYSNSIKSIPTLVSHIPFATYQVGLFIYYQISQTLSPELYTLYGIVVLLLQISGGWVQHLKAKTKKNYSQNQSSCYLYKIFIKHVYFLILSI